MSIYCILFIWYWCLYILYYASYIDVDVNISCYLYSLQLFPCVCSQPWSCQSYQTLLTLFVLRLSPPTLLQSTTTLLWGTRAGRLSSGKRTSRPSPAPAGLQSSRSQTPSTPSLRNILMGSWSRKSSGRWCRELSQREIQKRWRSTCSGETWPFLSWTWRECCFPGWGSREVAGVEKVKKISLPYLHLSNHFEAKRIKEKCVENGPILTPPPGGKFHLFYLFLLPPTLTLRKVVSS